LAKALRQLGHNVTVALPKTPGFQESGPLLARRLSPLHVEPGLDVTVLDGQLASGVSIVLFDAPEFSDIGAGFGSLGGVSEADGARSALLSRAAVALVRERLEQGKRVDVVHVHDWAAAPSVALLAADSTLPPSVLTLHGAADPTFEPESLARLGELVNEPRARVAARVSPLRLGLGAAREVTTVSPGYALELGKGPLGGLIEGLNEPLAGVLEGVDYAIFSPATDAAIESRYDAEDLGNKGRCKTALVRATGLRLETERPLLVALLAGTDAGGQKTLLRALPKLLTLPLGVVVLGEADAELTRALERLQHQYEGDLGLLLRGGDAELRRGIAAADFTLSVRSESPGAQAEVAALRYGAIPVALACGGVPDVVVDIDAELETGTGFLYAPLASEELVGAVERAVSAYGNERFHQLRRRVMRRDLGWDRPARRYLQIYRRLLGEKRAG
jgi:starch synthase